MRVKIMKLLGTTYIELDNIEVVVKYDDGYQLGDIGRVAHIIRYLYRDDSIPDYFKKQHKK